MAIVGEPRRDARQALDAGADERLVRAVPGVLRRRAGWRTLQGVRQHRREMRRNVLVESLCVSNLSSGVVPLALPATCAPRQRPPQPWPRGRRGSAPPRARHRTAAVPRSERSAAGAAEQLRRRRGRRPAVGWRPPPPGSAGCGSRAPLPRPPRPGAARAPTGAERRQRPRPRPPAAAPSGPRRPAAAAPTASLQPAAIQPVRQTCTSVVLTSLCRGRGRTRTVRQRGLLAKRPLGTARLRGDQPLQATQH